MADRTVKVNLKANVGGYIADVAKATAATRALRREAEAFEGRYNATLTVNDRASSGIRKAEQSLQKMSRASGDLEGHLAGLRKELADLQNGGASGARASGIADLNKQIERVKSNLASLNNQKITIPVATEITKGNIELADLQRRLEILDRSTYTPEIDIRFGQLRREIAAAERDLQRMAARVADQKLQINPGKFVADLRKRAAAAARSLPEIAITANSSDVDREIARIRAELDALSKVRAQYGNEAAQRTAQLQEALRRISASTTSAKVRADTGSAADDLGKVEKATDRVGASFRRATRENRQFNQGLLGTARTASNTAQAIGQLSMAPLVVGGIPAIASLTSSVNALGGAVATLPALGFAAGAGLAVIGIGLKNWADFSKELGKGKMGKAAKEAEKMAPAARETALALIEMSAAYDKAAEAVQEKLFKGSKQELQELADVYLPIIAKSLGSIAGELNSAGKAFSDFATQADTVTDAKDGLELIRESSERIAPIWVNLSRLMRDAGSVGARVLPEMAQGMENMTARWAAAVARGRATGSLQAWMREGMAETRQLGRVLVNTGGIFSGLGDAAQSAGLDTVGSLERMTGAAHAWIDSWQGQAEVSSFLADLQADVDAFTPGLKDLAGLAYDFVQQLSGSGTLEQLGGTFSSLAASARPMVEVLSQLTSAVLKPLLATVEALSPALGPVIAGMIAFRTASKGLDKIQTPLTNIGNRFDTAAQKATKNADAVSRVSRVTDRLSRALPFVGAVLVATAGAYEYLRDRSDDAAASVLNGSQTLQQAYVQEFEAIGRRKVALEPGVALTALFGSAQEKAALATNTAKEAIDRNNASIQEQINKMPPLQAAQARVTLAQQELTRAIDGYTIASPQARDAQAALTEAIRQAELQQYAAAVGTDINTAAQQRQRDMVLGARDAARGYAAAKDTASAAVAQNGRTLDINTAQGRANEAALDAMAQAGLRDLEAKRKQEGQTIAVTLRGRAHQDQLFNTAIQMGMSRDEAGRYVAQLGLVPESQETRFFTTGLAEAIGGVRDLGRAIGTLSGNAEVTLSGAVGDALKAGGFATGGKLRGPGTGTSDDILLRGSAGEWMIRERVASEQGDGRMAMLNSGQGTIVPRRAGGGPVTTDVTIDARKLAAEAKAANDRLFPPMPMGGGGGAQQWAGVASQALAMLGQSQALLPRVLQQIQIESSGNPRAINLWDINARRGTPSKGLIQTIDSTYAANADPRRNLGPYDPLSNLLAGIRYAIRRYGSIAAIWPTRGGYADGGVIPGVSNGDDKLALAQSGERVLTRTQNRDFERLVSVLERPEPISPYLAARVRGGDGPGSHVEIHNENHFREAVDLDLFNQRQDFAVRSSSF